MTPEKEKRVAKMIRLYSLEYEKESKNNLHGFTAGSVHVFTESFVIWLIEKLVK